MGDRIEDVARVLHGLTEDMQADVARAIIEYGTAHDDNTWWVRRMRSIDQSHLIR